MLLYPRKAAGLMPYPETRYCPQIAQAPGQLGVKSPCNSATSDSKGLGLRRTKLKAPPPASPLQARLAPRPSATAAGGEAPAAKGRRSRKRESNAAAAGRARKRLGEGVRNWPRLLLLREGVSERAGGRASGQAGERTCLFPSSCAGGAWGHSSVRGSQGTRAGSACRGLLSGQPQPRRE